MILLSNILFMTLSQKISLAVVRIVMGLMFFYAGITKVVNPEWTAAGYMKGAKNFVGMYEWFSSPGILPIVDFLNAWGLTLLGVALILGIAVRLGAFFGVIMMLMYYFVILDFPYPNAHAFIVDEHIIYSAVLVFLGLVGAGRYFGLGYWFSSLPIFSNRRSVRKILG